MKTQVFNPYLPSWEYIPDGEPHVFGDRLYIYGSHDAFDGPAYCVNDYVCWSAPIGDLTSWRNEGIIYKKEQDPLNPVGTRLLFAPDAARGPDGRYYLYYTLDLTGTIGAMSVAVCNSPAGKYEYYGAVHWPDGAVLGLKEGELLNFDPGVFVDDDKRVFLYSGIAPPNIGGLREKIEALHRITDGGYVIELAPDMVTIKSMPKRIIKGPEETKGSGFEGHAFFEASSMRRINGKYFFIYSSENSHELCYAVSDKPDADFRFGGTLVSIGDVFLNGRSREDALNYLGNTHGSIECVNGKWYVFYHRQTNLHQFSRQGCAEQINISPDGSIPQVEITSCGLNDGPLAGRGDYEARIACNLQSGNGVFAYGMVKPVDREHPYFTQETLDCEEIESQYIANMKDGSIAAFKYFLMDGADCISVVVRGDGGVLEISTETGAAPIAKIFIKPGDVWHTISASLSPVFGKQALYFSLRGNGSIDFKSFRLGG
ncbi:MAG: family 43 glycosylhydrolase [Treponema sp.]|jgi:hypothetical protein|nr:family 43 glycosylhydrolase [Treponema sp.]